MVNKLPTIGPFPAGVNNRRDDHALTQSVGNSSIDLLRSATNRLHLSARAYHRILKVARTIADLAGGDAIKTAHLTEAISYRALDRTMMR